MDFSKITVDELEEEDCKCECFEEECKCKCECVECDPDWTPAIDDYDDDTESEYDSDDSMDYVYEQCGLDRAEKKQLQEQLRYLEEQCVLRVVRPSEMMGTIPEEEEEELPPSK